MKTLLALRRIATSANFKFSQDFKKIDAPKTAAGSDKRHLPNKDSYPSLRDRNFFPPIDPSTQGAGAGGKGSGQQSARGLR